MSDLWTKFQGAIRWAGETFSRAAVATIEAASEAGFTDLVALTAAATSAPAASTDGLNVQGVDALDLLFFFSVAGESVTVRPYLYDSAGDAWAAADADITVTAQSGETGVYLDKFRVGTPDRIYLRVITAPSSGNITVRMSPFNDES